MIFKYDEKSLNYTKITGRVMVYGFLIILCISGCLSLFALKHINDVKFISEETRAIILKEADKENEFSREKLKAYILELNIRNPHIVLAQAEIETGHFTSAIFKQNHNLFGMKVATKRPTTNKGEENGHAYYDNWKESVVDYAFYSAQYLSDLKTEKDYLNYLSQNYAEDTNYVNKINSIIKAE
jgi:uncharacterized FlgJ-related protein